MKHFGEHVCIRIISELISGILLFLQILLYCWKYFSFANVALVLPVYFNWNLNDPESIKLRFGSTL